MRQTIAISPAGDEVLVLDDDDMARRLGVDYPSRSYSAALQQAPQRIAMLAALWQHGPAAERNGFATAVLVERAEPYSAEPIANPSQVLARPAVVACTERDINGKRTYEIRLVAVPRAWLPAIEQLVGAGGEEPAEEPAADERPPAAHETSGGPPRATGHGCCASTVATRAPDGPAEPTPPPEPAPAPDHAIADAVATALLARVVDIVSAGQAMAAAPDARRWEEEVSELERRLGEQVEYADKLRRQLRDLGDELFAVKAERDGLRTRLRSAEHNLKVATGADAQRIIDAEVRKQLDKVMRQAPGSQHAPDEAGTNGRRSA